MQAAQIENQRTGGVEISLRIGQRVRHSDYAGKRVTGVVRGLSVDSDRVLQADIVLDAPIVMAALSPDDREVSIWHQHVPAHELSPFDERDELMAELLEALERAERLIRDYENTIAKAGGSADAVAKAVRAAIAKATGSAAS